MKNVARFVERIGLAVYPAKAEGFFDRLIVRHTRLVAVLLAEHELHSGRSLVIPDEPAAPLSATSGLDASEQNDSVGGH